MDAQPAGNGDRGQALGHLVVCESAHKYRRSVKFGGGIAAWVRRSFLFLFCLAGIGNNA